MCEEHSKDIMAGKQTNWPYVINLGNSIIGVSVLAMPYCFKQCGMLLGVILLISSAWLTHVSCNLLIRAAVAARRRSYQYLAFHAFGIGGKLAVEICIIGLLIGTCVAFWVIIGDLGPIIISRATGWGNTSNLRTGLMISLGIFVVMPLGMLRNVESLSNVSALSIGFYTVFIVEVFATAFPNLWSGVWVASVVYWNPEGVFKCLPIFALAFSCQTQLFVIYDAILEPNIKRMNVISKNAVRMCTAVYLCVGFFGYIAFCDEEIAGDVLMNFKPTIFTQAIKFGFVLSVAVGFPLIIFPCRASIYTLFFSRVSEKNSVRIYSALESGALPDNISGTLVIPQNHFKGITVIIVLLTMIGGILVPNVAFILGLTGATMGSMICYIFPAIMFISVMSMSNSGSKSTAQMVLFIGVTLLLASTYVTIHSQDTAAVETQAVLEQDAPPVDDAVNDKLMPPVEVAGDGPAIGALEPGGDGGNEEEKKKEDVADKQEEEAKDIKDKLVEDQGQNWKEGEEDDRRHEPPNPLAPLDGEEDAEGGDVDKETANEGDGNDAEGDDHVARDADGVEGHHENDKRDALDVEDKEGAGEQPDEDREQDEEEEEEKPDRDADGDGEAQKQVETADKEEEGEEKEEAREILDALKKQQQEMKEQHEEQKQLIKEQKEIIEDLKRHQIEEHAKNDADGKLPQEGQVQGLPLQQQQPQQPQQVQQQPQQPQQPQQVQQQQQPQQGQQPQQVQQQQQQQPQQPQQVQQQQQPQQPQQPQQVQQQQPLLQQVQQQQQQQVIQNPQDPQQVPQKALPVQQVIPLQPIPQQVLIDTGGLPPVDSQMAQALPQAIHIPEQAQQSPKKIAKSDNSIGDAKNRESMGRTTKSQRRRGGRK